MRIFITALLAGTVLSACGGQSDTQALNEKQKNNYITSCENVMAKEPNTDPSTDSQFCKCTLEKLQTMVSAKSISHLSYMFKKIKMMMILKSG